MNRHAKRQARYEEYRAWVQETDARVRAEIIEAIERHKLNTQIRQAKVRTRYSKPLLIVRLPPKLVTVKPGKVKRERKLKLQKERKGKLRR